VQLADRSLAGDFALAEPLEKSSTPSGLPDPRLNPLMNPTLGRNLGRWAQVYFTSPPEKRESAVVELLRELEGDAAPAPSLKPAEEPRPVPTQSAASAPPVVHEIATHATAAPVVETKPVEPLPAVVAAPEINSTPPVKNDARLQEQIECPSCREKSPTHQAYCGICGVALHSAGAERTTEAAPARTGAPSAYVESELQWLRQRVPENWSEEESESSHAGRFVVVALVIALGIIAYIEWGPRNAAVAPTTSVIHAPASVAPPSAEITVPVKAPPALASPAVTNAEAGPKVQSESKHVATEDRAPEATPSSVGGGQELVEAQRILAIPGQSGDTSEAAKLLWKAVGKQNASATLMLADLYLRGEGVPRNCEQARVLLSAAAKKGSNDAAGKLRQVEASGCP
jgi:hypothetical protein